MLSYDEFVRSMEPEWRAKRAATRPSPKPKARKRRGERLKGAAYAGRHPDVRLMASDPCAYCNGPGEAYDHIVPRYDGGKNHYDNVTRSCRRCNSRKNNRPLLLFLAEG